MWLLTSKIINTKAIEPNDFVSKNLFALFSVIIDDGVFNLDHML